MSNSNLPAICADLRLRADGSVPVVNSRDVAEMFGKRHDHVLRDIDQICHAPNLGDGWFREVVSGHPTVVGRVDRSFDLTRDGFTLLAMGWTGEKAMAFKVRYIEAFNAMEKALNDGESVSGAYLIRAIREIVAPLAVRHDSHDRAIERLDARVDNIANDTTSIKAKVTQIEAKMLDGRRRLTKATKDDHIQAVRDMGGRCPCCSQATVVADGIKSRFSEFDHFYTCSKPSAEHTWLICAPCHQALTTGRTPRDQREAEFRSYQNKRRRLPGRQANLFDPIAS